MMDRVNVAALFSEVIRLETELWNAVDKQLREVHDLPLARFEPMQVIGRTSPCRVNDIAEALSITVGGTSKIVDRIEAFGLCRRRPDPDDGRSSLIELTPTGRRLLADATCTFVDALELRLCSTVPQRSLEQFAVIVGQLRKGLQAHNEKNHA